MIYLRIGDKSIELNTGEVKKKRKKKKNGRMKHDMDVRDELKRNKWS